MRWGFGDRQSRRGGFWRWCGLQALRLGVFAVGSYVSLYGVALVRYQHAGYHFREHGYLLQLPFSQLGVEEVGIDTTRDGHVDKWLAKIGESDSFVVYETQDLDGDGHGDTVAISIGQNGKFAAFRESDYDEMKQSFESHEVTLGNHSDLQRRYKYVDLDLDGEIDVMARENERLGEVEEKIRAGTKWLDAKRDADARKFRVAGEDGQERPYVYDFDAKSFVPNE